MLFVFFFKQKTAYEMRISDWSSDVCSSDLRQPNSTSQTWRFRLDESLPWPGTVEVRKFTRHFKKVLLQEEENHAVAHKANTEPIYSQLEAIEAELFNQI